MFEIPVLLAVSHLILVFAVEPVPKLNMAEDTTTDKIISGNTKFATEIYQEVSKSHPDSNLFFSPFSLSTALSMTLVGARENTELEMNTVLGCAGIDKSSLHDSYNNILSSLASVASVANRIFVQENFDVRDEFTQVLETKYNSGCTKMDFSSASAANIINEWVEKETRGKIAKLVNSLSSNTAMIIANAIYFKSYWNKKFQPSNTQVAPFYVNEQETVNVNMMFQEDKFGLAFHEVTETEVLELDHDNGRTSMLIFLPQGNLQQFESAFGTDLLQDVLPRISVMKTKVWLPAFKLEESYNLKSVLVHLGMSDLFSIPKANLAGIGDNLYASEVVHKSFIEVNEEGTEAAAATGIRLQKRSLDLSPTFRADRPFLFCILDKLTKNIIFLGRLAKPEPVPGSGHEEL